MRMIGSSSTVCIASTWERPCTPEPSTATVREPGRASSLVAAPETAAVRISVIGDALRIAISWPVVPSWSSTAPWCGSSPRAELPPATTISLREKTGASPPAWAGIRPIAAGPAGAIR